MSFYVSAGVYSVEKDLSDIVPNISTTTAALVGYSTKGDIDEIKLITNSQQFINEYGEPVVGQYFHYTALAFLENGTRLYCQRVVKSALYGGVNIAYTGTVSAALPTGYATKEFQAISGSNFLFSIFAKDPGTWNNKIGIRITNLVPADYEFDIEVYYQNDDGNYVKVESFTVSRKTKLDGYGRQIYLETRVNGFSDYIYVSDNTIQADTVMPLAQATTLAFAQGSNGSAVTDSEVVAGWAKFINPDDVDVRLLLNGGYTSSAVQTEMKLVAETRKDCIAILDMDPTQTTSVAAMTAWRATQNFNSSYCALYAPMVKIYDQWNDVTVPIVPSGYVAGQIAYNDYVGKPWLAPAGFNRGLLNVLGVCDVNGDRLVFTQGERDSLYEEQINPIQLFEGQGIAIWGQKTEQTKASALDRINVRRLLIVLEKAISASLQYFVFEPNSDLIRYRIVAMAESYLDNLQAQGAFQTEVGGTGYKVICDATNNTADVIDRNELHVDIFIKPSRAAEFIQLGVIITTTGASFNELVSRQALP